MKRIELDFSLCQTIKQLHEYIAGQMEFPDYYGYNLDALYDCLTEISEETVVDIEGVDYLDYREQMILTVFKDAEQNNKMLSVNEKKNDAV